MTATSPTQVPGDKMKKAIQLLSELLEQDPDSSRSSLLQKVQIQLDLTPMECEFLNRHFASAETE